MKRSISDLRTIFWPAFSTRAMRRIFTDDWGTDWKGLVLNWRRRKRAASSLAVLHAKMRTSAARSRRSLPFWGLRIIAARPRRDTSRLNAEPVGRNWAQSLRKFTEWAKKARHVLKKGEMLRQARTRVIGHLNYYAITDNSERCSYYVYRTTQILFKWLNRKSQRKAYTWENFTQALIWAKWPQPISPQRPEPVS